MLATSKMTGLDLVNGGPNLGHGHGIKDDPDCHGGKRSSSSSDEMLSTPKLLPDSAGGHHGNFSKVAAASFMMQSRQAVTLASLATSAGSISPGRHSEHSTNNNIHIQNIPPNGDGEGMLMTPVVTTPKTSDLWMTHPAHTPPHLRTNFEPSGTSPGAGYVLIIKEFL